MTLKASVATRDITPTHGEDLSGYAARKQGTTGVHDRLHSKWLCLDDGYQRVLLGGNDLLGFSRSFAADVRRRLAAETGMPASNIHLAATHTHSGPATADLRGCGSVSPAYLAWLRERLVEGGKAAAQARPRTVAMGVATGKGGGSFNRRRGRETPIDNTLSVLALRDAKTQKPVATLVNFNCHAVVMGAENVQVSADYPGALQAAVEKQAGGTCIFLQGACGDVNPVVCHSVDFRDVEKMGEGLAAEVARLMKRMTWTDNAPLFHARTTVKLPVHKPSVAELKKRFADAKAAFSLSETLFAERFDRYCRMVRENRFPRFAEAPVSVLGLGEQAGIVFLPAEVFNELGAQIRHMAPWKNTFVCGFTDGVVGYIPTRQQYELGGYETWLAPLFYGLPEYDPSVGNVALEAARKLLDKAHLALIF